MFWRGVQFDLMLTAAAGIATIVCVLLHQRLGIKPIRLFRLFILIVLATLSLELSMVSAFTSRPTPPAPSRSTG